jgi:hypothetical protein
MPCSGSAPPRASWGCGPDTPRPGWKQRAPRQLRSATRPTPAIKGILVAGTEATTAAKGSAGCGAGVPAFLHGPRALFEPGSGGDLAPVLELNTGPTTSTGTGPSDEAAQA